MDELKKEFYEKFTANGGSDCTWEEEPIDVWQWIEQKLEEAKKSEQERYIALKVRFKDFVTQQITLAAEDGMYEYCDELEKLKKSIDN